MGEKSWLQCVYPLHSLMTNIGKSTVTKRKCSENAIKYAAYLPEVKCTAQHPGRNK
jgi:hypothetical protein